eukprot:m.309789 g.309789  ORF g.309789 m.309789 type:complete len:99 (+) comp47791_c0_seq1:234-530(+)
MEVLEKVTKLFDGVITVKKAIEKATGDEGNILVQGRHLHYKVKGGIYGWKLKYTGKAWDEQSGVEVSSKHWKSQAGARSHVLEDLVNELKKRKLLQED